MKRVITALLLSIGVCGCSSDPEPGASEPGTDSGVDAATEGGTDAGADSIEAAAEPDDLTSALEPIRAAHELPALAAAVWRGDQLIARGVSGVRKLGDPTLASVDDRWHLGSDTKAMTATRIGIYVERGDIHFEDTIGSLFSGETVDPGYAPVTIRELLEHRGGAPGSVPSYCFGRNELGQIGPRDERERPRPLRILFD